MSSIYATSTLQREKDPKHLLEKAIKKPKTWDEYHIFQSQFEFHF